VTGTVIDHDTGGPVANTLITVEEVYFRNGRRWWGAGGTARTDGNGDFRVDGLRPGEYVAVINPQYLGATQRLPQFREEDLTAIDTDNERTYWPGGHGLQTASPVQAVSGTTASVGTVHLSKVKFYRAHLKIPDSDCAGGTTLLVTIKLGDSTTNVSQGTCSNEFLFRGLEPGTYSLEIWTEKESVARRRRGIVDFTITDRNVEVTAPLLRGVDIEGRFVTPEQSHPDLSAVTVSLEPVNSIRFFDERPTAVNSEGRFHVTNVIGFRRCVVSGLAHGLYVKGIRFAGFDLQSYIIRPSEGNLNHDLEIVLSDKPAVLTGIVFQDDHPLPGALVMITRWPVGNEDVFGATINQVTSANGVFQSDALPPGAYRVLSFPAEDRPALDLPGALFRYLEKADHYDAVEGVTTTLNLKTKRLFLE
jgi:hypothetical protein